jgi:Tfp pilus assembly protein PilN
MLIAGFNLAREEFRQERRAVLLAAGAGAVLTLLLLGQVAAWLVVRRDVQVTGSRLARMEAEFRRHQEGLRAVRGSIPEEAVKRYEAKVLALNKILEASAFSWTGLLMELERTQPPGIALSEIHPDLTTGQVTLRGTAQSFDNLGRFLRGLEQRTAFRDVYLLRQSERKAQAAGQAGLDFAVTLIYEGRGP